MAIQSTRPLLDGLIGDDRPVLNIPVVVANTKKLVANNHDMVANISKHGVYADKEARKEYQRDLMRKRRAEAKNGKTNS